MRDIAELKRFFDSLERQNIIFTSYFYSKIEERPYLNEEFVINSIKNTKGLEGFQKQLVRREERYRIGIKLSNKYNLVIIAKIEGKSLYIITAWKTNRKWQRAIQK